MHQQTFVNCNSHVEAASFFLPAKHRCWNQVFTGNNHLQQKGAWGLCSAYHKVLTFGSDVKKRLPLLGAHKNYLPLLVKGKYVYNSLSLRIQISPFMLYGRQEVVSKAQLTCRATWNNKEMPTSAGWTGVLAMTPVLLLHFFFTIEEMHVGEVFQ